MSRLLEARPEDSEREPKGLSVVLVEDSEELVVVETASLKIGLPRGLAITHFASGKEAIDFLKKTEIKPQVIIVDFHLEGEQTGFDVAEWTRDNLPDVLVVLATNDSDVLKMDTSLVRSKGVSLLLSKSDPRFFQLGKTVKDLMKAKRGNEIRAS